MPTLDPFDWFDQANQQQADPAAIARAKAQLRQPFQPDEEDSLLRKAVGAGASGLSFAAGTLDKLFGGRAIRGALGGVPRELLSAIPGSDVLGITDPNDRVSGEQLLKNAGILEGDGEKGTFELRDLAGPALEAALDPGTYLTFGAGALTKEGQLARKLGALPESAAGRIAGHGTPDALAAAMGRTLPEATQAASNVGININDLIGKPLGGLGGFRVPFTGMDPAVFGTGGTGSAIAGKMGNLYDKSLYSTPGRYLSAAFDPTVKGALEGGVQGEWRAESAAARSRDVQRRLDALGVAQPLIDAGSPELSSGPDNPLRRLVEGAAHPGGPYTQEQLAALNESANRYRSVRDRVLQNEQGAGLSVEPLTSMFGTEYAARSPTPLEQASGVKGGMPREQFSHQLYSGIGAGIQRDPILDVPGGTDAINRMVMDPRIGTKARTVRQLPDVLNILNSEFLKPDPQRLSYLESLVAGGHQLSPAEEAEIALERHKASIAEPLARYLGGLDPRRQQAGLFGNDAISDLMRRMESGDRAIGRANVATRRVGSDAIVGRPQPGFTPLEAILQNLKLSETGGDNIMDLMRARGLTPSSAHGVQVPNDVASAVQALIPKLPAPDYVKGPLGLFDSITNLTRTLQTAPWPGKHVRDLTTAFVQNLQAGSPGATTFGAPVMKALREGRDVPGLAEAIPEFKAAGLTDAEATAALGRELFSQQAAGRGMGSMSREGVTAGSTAGDSFAKAVPGLTPEKGLLDIAKDFIPKNAEQANPLNVAAFNGRNTSKFAPVAAGRELGDLFDDMGRGGLYADLRRQGYVPDAAGKAVESTQFKYELSDFERKVMRRLVPFYSWMRQVVPQQLGFLAQAPGGLEGQAIRAADDMRQQRGFTPPYLDGGLSIPVGGQDESGTQRYLTKLDMPWEDPFSMINTGPRGAQTTMMSMLSQLNPLIKGPLEYATGKQFYTGRDLDSLYARTGSQVADQVLMNSPGSRALTTLGTLADERKDPLTTLFNLGTGVRLSDVDMNKQKQQVAIDLLKEQLRQNPNTRVFQDLHVPPEKLPLLSPDELQMLRLYNALESQASKDAKARKRQVATNPK